MRFELEKSQTTTQGTFIGYASTREPDAQGDIILPSAFAKSVGQRVPVLFDHLSSLPVGSGVVERITEKGAQFRGRLNLGTEKGREAFALISAGDVTGLSIRGRVVKSQPRSDGYREISEVALAEVSITPLPANNSSRIETVHKSFAADAQRIASAIADGGRIGGNLSFSVAMKSGLTDGTGYPREESRDPLWPQRIGTFPRFHTFLRQHETGTGSMGLIAVTDEVRNPQTSTVEGGVPAPDYHAEWTLATGPSIKWAVVPIDASVEILSDAPALRQFLEVALLSTCEDIIERETLASVLAVAGNAGAGTDLLEAATNAAALVAGVAVPSGVMVNAQDLIAAVGAVERPLLVGGVVPLIPSRIVAAGEVLAFHGDSATFFTNGEAKIDIGWASGNGLSRGMRRVQALRGHSVLVGNQPGFAKATYP